MLTSAQRESNVVRLSRFLENEGVKLDSWYAPQARAVLARLSAAGAELRLMVDGSKVGTGHQLLMVSLAYRRRAIPIAWTWIKHKRGHSSVKAQQRLLMSVRALIPEDGIVSLVGDSEFGHPKLLVLLESWGWLYALRQSGKELYQDPKGDWHKLNKTVQEGQSRDCR